MGVCPCVKRNFEYDDAKTNVKRYGGEGRLDGFEATFLSSYLACSAVFDVESCREKKKKKRGIVLAKESTISRGGTRVIRRARKEIRLRSYTRGSRHLVYLQIPFREWFDRGANGGQNVGVVGSGGRGRGKGGGSRSMNEAECVLAIANGLCQAFRDLATAVLNPRYLRDRWRTFRGPAWSLRMS